MFIERTKSGLRISPVCRCTAGSSIWSQSLSGSPARRWPDASRTRWKLTSICRGSERGGAQVRQSGVHEHRPGQPVHISMDGKASSTTSSSSGCGARSNTSASICTIGRPDHRPGLALKYGWSSTTRCDRIPT